MMLKTKVIRNNINAMANKAWKWSLPMGASPISAAIAAVIGRTGWFIDADGNRVPISLSTAVLLKSVGAIVVFAMLAARRRWLVGR